MKIRLKYKKFNERYNFYHRLNLFFGYNECEGGNNVYDSDNTIAAYI